MAKRQTAAVLEAPPFVDPRRVWYQCVHCTRKTQNRDDFTKDDDSVCKVCADAFERSGVEIKGHEPSPRRLQRKTHTEKRSAGKSAPRSTQRQRSR